MKTFSLNNKVSSYILLLALGLLAVSCGSYNETSYYGNDGIYSRRGGEQMVETSQRTSYFADFSVYNVPEDNEPVGIFTDIDSYYGDETYSTGYSGWGNSTNDVTVNVYGGGWYGGGLGWYGGWGWGNPYWGMGWGWNSWHNPYWGWGGGYGWGWNSWHNPYWGWGGYYPYYNNVAYYRGPRGGYYASDYAYRNRNFANTANTTRSNSRAYEVRGRNDNATRSNNSRFTTNSSRNTNLGTSRSATINNSRNNSSTRSSTINNSRNNTINNSNRNNTINNSNRNNNSVPNRSGSMNSGSSRSSSMGSGSSGGSRSSGMGGGGGSRSSGGGRR